MNRVGVPRTWPEARPLSTSRRIRPATEVLARSRSKAATSGPTWGGVPLQVAVFECLLPVEQQFVHVPEPALPGGGLGRGRGGEGVRVDAGQREMPERGPNVPAELASTCSIAWNAAEL